MVEKEGEEMKAEKTNTSRLSMSRVARAVRRVLFTKESSKKCKTAMGSALSQPLVKGKKTSDDILRVTMYSRSDAPECSWQFGNFDHGVSVYAGRHYFSCGFNNFADFCTIILQGIPRLRAKVYGKRGYSTEEHF